MNMVLSLDRQSSNCLGSAYGDFPLFASTHALAVELGLETSQTEPWLSKVYSMTSGLDIETCLYQRRFFCVYHCFRTLGEVVMKELGM